MMMNNKIEILFNNECIMAIPSHLSYLAEEIQSSTYMLSYQDNWDDEGSVGYTLDTWQKAINLLLLIADFAYKNYEEEISIPSLNHGDDGGIELYQEDTNHKKLMLLNKEVSESIYAIHSIGIDNNHKGKIAIPDIFHGKKGGVDFLIENQHISKLIRLDKNISIADYCILKKLKPSEVITEGEYLEPYSTVENFYLFFKKS